MAKEGDAQRIAKNYVRKLARDITVRRAILTGSRATGSYLEDSDVDLIIVSDDFSKMPLPDRLRYLQKQWTSRLPLEAFGYTVDEFRLLQRKSTYVKEAVRNGIVLVGEPGKLRDSYGTWKISDKEEKRIFSGLQKNWKKTALAVRGPRSAAARSSARAV